jgi:hypothetical protein
MEKMEPGDLVGTRGGWNRVHPWGTLVKIDGKRALVARYGADSQRYERRYPLSQLVVCRDVPSWLESSHRRIRNELMLD